MQNSYHPDNLESNLSSRGFITTNVENLDQTDQSKSGLKKTFFLVSVYVYKEETEKILVNCLKQLKQTNIPIMIVSNSPIRTETMNLVDYFIYIKEAPFFGDHYSEIPLMNFWFGNEIFELEHWIPSYQRYGLSIFRNLFTGLDLAQSLGFDSFIWMTGDNDFGPVSIERLKNMPNECSELNKKALIYINGPSNLSTVPLCSNIEYFKNLFPCIKKEEDYIQLLLEFQGNLNFLDVERFLGLVLELRGDDKILRKNGMTDLFSDFSDAKWNLITAVYTTDPKYSGCVTSPFNLKNSKDGSGGKCVFSRNQRDTPVVRDIEVYIQDNLIESFSQELEPGCWKLNYFPDFKKIRVFENGKFLYEESINKLNVLSIK